MKNIADLFESGQQSSQKGHFRNLVQMARHDGEVLATERALLNKIAQKLSLTDQQIQEILDNPDEYPFIPPSSKEERLERFIRLIQMAQVDGVISESEEHLIKRSGYILGFEEDSMKEHIKWIIDRIKAGKTSSEILEDLMK